MAFTMPFPSLARPSNLVGTAEYVIPPVPNDSVANKYFFQICMLAEKSIRNVLNTNDNVDVLLSLHLSKSTPQTPMADMTMSNKGIRT